MDIKHEYDHSGLHRIRVEGSVGFWSLYEQPAVLTIDGTVYIAFTPYFDQEDEDTVVVGRAVKAAQGTAAVCNFANSEEPCNHRSVLTAKEIALLEANGIKVL